MNLRLMTIDDEKYLHQGLDKLINWESLGITRIAEAYDGQTALDKIQCLRPDIILSDIRMPKIDGLSLIAEVKKLGGYDPIWVILSGYSEFSFAQKAMQFGVRHYLLKPVDPDELVATLKSIKPSGQQEPGREEDLLLPDLERLQRLVTEPLSQESLTPFLTSFQGKRFFQLILRQNLPNPSKSISNLLLKLNQPHGARRVLRLRDNFWGFLLDSSELPSGYLEEFLQAFRDYAQRGDLGHLYIMVSPPLDSERILHRTLQFFQKATVYLPYDPQGAVLILPENSELFPPRDPHLKEMIFFPDLIKSVQENQPQEIQRHVAKIEGFCRTKGVTLEILRTWISCLAMDIVRLIIEQEGHLSEPLKAFKDPKNLDALVLSQGLFPQVEVLCLEAAEALAALKKLNKGGVIVNIAQYVRENFHKNLSLRELGGLFELSPVYLGQLFKKQYGISFKKFLSEIRIEEAKRLLSSTDLRVYEVAHSVGYADSDYFTEQFIKSAGISPSVYREMD